MNHKLHFEESFTQGLQGELFLPTVAGEFAALPPSSPLCPCSGGSLLCSYLGNSGPHGWAKGPLGGLWAALSNGRGRQELTICWVQGLSSPQQGPGKAITWPLLIDLKMWESAIWQEANKTNKQKNLTTWSWKRTYPENKYKKLQRIIDDNTSCWTGLFIIFLNKDSVLILYRAMVF